MMRPIALLLLLGGCGLMPDQWLMGAGAAGIGSIAIIQRTPLDAAYSLISGRDCSAVRLDKGQSYCRQEEPPPEPPPFCTRGLGAVTCWRDPTHLPGSPTPVADGPSTLTVAQEANRTRGWPF